ncbi:copper resistance system multicopper oxidase [Sphingomonas sp. Ant20]|uniref:copper resistance system multicopper oxidase n=1 Tax=Sphingomonas sp. Ant20 TaxID=104605 RepID=UPI002741A52D|nr:copper resistance system multicopper oxidase [Sphingomonas sp. Ant20]
MSRIFDRRQMLRGAALAGGGVALTAYMPAWAQPVSGGIVKPLPVVSGAEIALTIDSFKLPVDGKSTPAIGVNGTVPAPLIRLKEGQKVRLSVTNNLDVDSSIHWHGLLVPFPMDGVPGISFPGIKARSTFVYEFPIIQAGTYWYHSHSGAQEQGGLYGPIVIDPAGTDPIGYDREHVIVLSDHSQMTGDQIFRKLKQMGGAYFNYQRPTLAGLLAGREMPLKDRIDWGKMRMDPADIADVTGSTYTFLVNGYGPYDNWTGLFKAGERVRLRIINAAAQTNFTSASPDLPMTVVQADGQNVRPVQVDEFQIGVAETFDVIVMPGDRAYSFVSEAIDRSGMGRATLAPREGMIAPVPPLRPRTLLTMTDMGMDMGSMGGMQGMSGMSEESPVVKRGADPTLMQNASRNLWKLTGWKEPTDHGTVAVGAAMGGMSGMSGMDHSKMSGTAMPGMDHSQVAAGGAGMAGMDQGQMSSGAAMPGMDHSAMKGGSSQAGGMAGMDHGSGGSMNMSMRDPKNAPGARWGRACRPFPRCRKTGVASRRRAWKTLTTVSSPIVTSWRSRPTRTCARHRVSSRST